MIAYVEKEIREHGNALLVIANKLSRDEEPSAQESKLAFTTLVILGLAALTDLNRIADALELAQRVVSNATVLRDHHS